MKEGQTLLSSVDCWLRRSAKKEAGRKSKSSSISTEGDIASHTTYDGSVRAVAGRLFLKA